MKVGKKGREEEMKGERRKGEGREEGKVQHNPGHNWLIASLHLHIPD